MASETQAGPLDRLAGTDRAKQADEREERKRAAVAARERGREEFGGFNIGAAFFGWLVATGLAALLAAILTAAGATIGLTEVSGSEASKSAGAISLAGGILLLVVVLVAYFAGGYVAGRLSRFDGGRQGFGAWLFGIVITVALAILGAIFGAKYNVLGQLQLPRVPVDEGSLAKGGIIALAAMVIGTALASIFGGKAGERYHRKVDRAGIER